MQRFILPQSTQRYKKIPKNKLIQKTKYGVDGSKIFADIASIAITHWLSESTINISKTNVIKEILILEIDLKETIIPKEAIKIIQNSLGSNTPILFTIKHGDDFCYGISLLDEKKYYFSKWNEEKEFNFVDTNLEKVYQNIVKLFLSNIEISTDKNIDFKQTIELDKQITDLTKKIDALKAKMFKEKQFNKKTELNKQLKNLQKELQTLKG